MRRAASPFMRSSVRTNLRSLAVCSVLALAPHAMRAQSSGADSFTGRYVLDSARSDRIDVRVEEAVRNMNFIKRPIARKRLLRVNQASPVLELRFHGDTGRLVVPGESPIPLVLRQTDVSWTNAEGERFVVQTFVTKGTRPVLVVQFDAKDGTRVNLYSFDSDRLALGLTVTVASPQLDTPLRYTLRYTREPAKPAP